MCYQDLGVWAGLGKNQYTPPPPVLLKYFIFYDFMEEKKRFW